jgi:hypothetical protein
MRCGAGVGVAERRAKEHPRMTGVAEEEEEEEEETEWNG